MRVQLSQEKIEHAVLWSIVRHDYSDGFIDSDHVAQKLNGFFAPSQISAALKHLADCGMLEHRHAPMQEHFAPTRLAFIKIDQLSSIKPSFVGRLNTHGVKFLNSQAAKDARLESQILPPVVTDSSATKNSGPDIQISVAPIISPSFSNSGPVYEAPKATEGGNQSATRAAWFSGWGTWIAAAIALAAIIVPLWVSGKI